VVAIMTIAAKSSSGRHPARKSPQPNVRRAPCLRSIRPVTGADRARLRRRRGVAALGMLALAGVIATATLTKAGFVIENTAETSRPRVPYRERDASSRP
jgi:hypothetical protein